jgi:hypothetical protein
MKKILLTLAAAMFTYFAVNAQTATKPTTTTTTVPTTTTAPTQNPDNPNGPVIQFPSLVHDYGTLQKGADGNCEFTFTNTGKEPLVLSNVTTSCGCTVPSWNKEPILPGKTGVIKVNYTKTNIVGTISKQITVMSNAKNGTIILSIKGQVVDTPSTTPEKPVNPTLAPTTPVTPTK